MSTNAPVKSKARDPRAVQLERLAGGDYAALSSDGVTFYTVCQVGTGWQCACKGFAARGACCHAKAAQLDRCFWCLSTVEVETFSNGADHGEPIQLCGACLTATIPDNCAEHRSGCNGRHSA